MNPLKEYFHIPKEERQTYLDLVQEKVEKYKPLIEKKTGVELGDISVREYHKLIPNIIEELVKELNSELSKKGLGVISRTLTECIFLLVFTPLFSLVNSAVGYFYTSMKCHNYPDLAIYVPFGHYERIKRLKNNLEIKKKYLDEMVVHELSHILEEKLGGDREKKLSFRLPLENVWWSEGFAVYCQQNWFADFYPKDYKLLNLDQRGLRKYKRVKKKIERLVKIRGENILFRIPKEIR